jgi:uncharacterized protein (TIGR02996 family)
MSSSPRAEVLALLADVKEHPDEDSLRLILADWLEDHGDAQDQPRAELIRCQISHERLPADHPDKNAAGRRARWLQQNHGTAWLGPLAKWLAAWTFRRGLLSVSVDASMLRGQGMALLAASETWAWVDEVYLLGLSDPEVPRLGKCALLDAVVSLGFRRCDLGPAGAAALAELPLAQRLRCLDLSLCPIADRGTAALAQSPQLAGLWSLNLAGCQLTPNAASPLAGANTPFADLRRLVLWGNPLDDLGARRLASSPGWPRLRQLDLRSCRIGDRGGQALAGWVGLAPLRELNLADNAFGPDAALALAASAHLETIESLTLWGNPLGAEGVGRLRERFASRVHVTT